MNPYPDVASLLASRGLSLGDDELLEHNGFSGATLTRLISRDGSAFVLKRMSIDRDWIMRATDDVHCREAAFAQAEPDLGPTVCSPVIGIAADGSGHALLMRDISPYLLETATIDRRTLDIIVRGMAKLHRQTTPTAPVPWCPVDQRLTLLSPANIALATSYKARVAGDLALGWPAFAKHASPRARSLIYGLAADSSPLLGALDRVPSALLHGDLKLDNIGLSPDGRLWLIDWAMTLIAPPSVELGWFLAMNSRSFTVSLDEVLDLYAEAAQIPSASRHEHDMLTALCGLMLRGWRKGLDAEEGELEELAWWCERVEAAASLL